MYSLKVNEVTRLLRYNLNMALKESLEYVFHFRTPSPWIDFDIGGGAMRKKLSWIFQLFCVTHSRAPKFTSNNLFLLLSLMMLHEPYANSRK